MDNFDRGIIIFFIMAGCLLSIVSSMEYTNRMLCEKDGNTYVHSVCLKDKVLVK